MNTANDFRNLYESCARRNGKGSSGNGRRHFVNTIRHALGLCNERGIDHRDVCGNRVLREAKIDPGSINVTQLGYDIIGYDFKRYYDPSNPGSLHGLCSHNLALGNRGSGALLEAAGVGVDVSAFADINAWTSVVGGLIEVKILEGFQNPLFIADKLMPPEPTKLNGQKIIAPARIGPQAAPRTPGMPHQRATFGERWVQTPETQENALACDLYKEAVFFDLTGQVLQHAQQVGEWVGYNKEIRVIDHFIGVTSQSGGKTQFNYKGTGQNTYATSRTTGYLNDFTGNELLDFSSVDSAWQQFQRQQDAETGTRILTMPDTVLVMPGKVTVAQFVFDPRDTERRSAGSATQSTAAALNISTVGGMPGPWTKPEILWSPLVEQRATDADGLALSQSAATKLWFWWQRQKFCRYMANWPMTITPAPANSYDMIDRGIAASYYANERGTPSTWYPWYGQRNAG